MIKNDTIELEDIDLLSEPIFRHNNSPGVYIMSNQNCIVKKPLHEYIPEEAKFVAIFNNTIHRHSSFTGSYIVYVNEDNLLGSKFPFLFDSNNVNNLHAGFAIEYK